MPCRWRRREKNGLATLTQLTKSLWELLIALPCTLGFLHLFYFPKLQLQKEAHCPGGGLTHGGNFTLIRLSEDFGNSCHLLTLWDPQSWWASVMHEWEREERECAQGIQSIVSLSSATSLPLWESSTIFHHLLTTHVWWFSFTWNSDFGLVLLLYPRSGVRLLTL